MSTNFEERVNMLAKKYCFTHMTQEMTINEMFDFICEYFLGKKSEDCKEDISQWSDTKFEQMLHETIGYSAYILKHEDKHEVFDLLRLKAKEK